MCVSWVGFPLIAVMMDEFELQLWVFCIDESSECCGLNARPTETPRTGVALPVYTEHRALNQFHGLKISLKFSKSILLSKTSLKINLNFSKSILLS